MEDSKKNEKLLHDLQNKEAYVRMTAAEDAGNFTKTDNKVISTLRIVADLDENKFVRQAAATALVKLGVEENPQINKSVNNQNNPLNQQMQGKMTKNKDWRYFRGLVVIIIGIIGIFLGAPFWFPLLMILFGVLMMFIFK